MIYKNKIYENKRYNATCNIELSTKSFNYNPMFDIFINISISYPTHLYN